MFQSFNVTSEKSKGADRVKALRQKLKDLNLDAFVVPHSDEHQNEYLPIRAERLAWLTGFTGSAGFAVILAKRALVFTDGRYTLQVEQQTDETVFETGNSVTVEGTLGIKEWGAKNMRIGIDPWLHTMESIDSLRKQAEHIGAELVHLKANPIDEIWDDQPDPPRGMVKIHGTEFAGTAPKPKLNEIGKTVRESGADVTVLTDPNSICWAFNIRGLDVVHTPLVLAFAIVPAKGDPKLFIDMQKLGTEEHAYLNQLCDLYEPEQFDEHLNMLGEYKTKVLLDPSLVAMKLATTLEDAGAEIIKGVDPCRLPRARKNKTERKGAIEAHKRDGAAMVSFLAWLDSQKPED
ncbi:MAG: aminopeptidase P family N-terminal domain-containing protein, partial [Pseudomonadota bacterium]